jgi:hypothetical protein
VCKFSELSVNTENDEEYNHTLFNSYDQFNYWSKTS